jgi:hypothetical protein
MRAFDTMFGFLLRIKQNKASPDAQSLRAPIVFGGVTNSDVPSPVANPVPPSRLAGIPAHLVLFKNAA